MKRIKYTPIYQGILGITPDEYEDMMDDYEEMDDYPIPSWGEVMTLTVIFIYFAAQVMRLYLFM